MITCPKCGKENQDHYKFCLGCGNELPRDGGGQRPFRAPTPAARNAVAPAPGPMAVPAPQNFQPVAPPPAQPQVAPPGPFNAPPAPGPFGPAQFGPGPQAQPFQAVAPPPAQPFQPVAPPPPVAAPPPPQAAPGFPASCPQCSSANPRGNRFCITCGFDMSTAAPAAAPPPQAAQAPTVAVPQQPLPPTGRAPAIERARLVLIRPDGTEGGTHPLGDGDTPIGRTTESIFGQDLYLSPVHATFSIQGGSVTVRDESSLNGIYVRIERQQAVELRDGDVFRVGQEILRYEAFPAVQRSPDGTERLGAELEGLVGKIVLVTGRESAASAFPVPVTGLYLGRERGDILFPEDGYVSGLHCQLVWASNRLTLTDVGSSNGSYVRIRGSRSLRNGDFLLLGQQLFRLQMA